MHIALPVFFALLISAVIVFTHENIAQVDDTPDLSLPAYSACHTDSDCTLIALPCGGISGLRKERRAEVRHYYSTRQENAVTRGAAPCTPQIPTEIMQAACRDNRCTALPAPKTGEE